MCCTRLPSGSGSRAGRGGAGRGGAGRGGAGRGARWVNRPGWWVRATGASQWRRQRDASIGPSRRATGSQCIILDGGAAAPLPVRPRQLPPSHDPPAACTPLRGTGRGQPRPGAGSRSPIYDPASSPPPAAARGERGWWLCGRAAAVTGGRRAWHSGHRAWLLLGGSQQPAASSQQPAASSQQPAASSQQPAASSGAAVGRIVGVHDSGRNAPCTTRAQQQRAGLACKHPAASAGTAQGGLQHCGSAHQEGWPVAS
jgi:hypothetical protein